MPPPNQVKDFLEADKKLKTILLSNLSNGDKQWEDHVIACSKNLVDDPPILPGWNLRPCEEFLKKAVAYGGGGGPVLPPAPLFGGAHPAAPVTTAGIQRMQLEILTYLAHANPGSSVIGGANGAVGLVCTALQFGIACVQWRGLELLPWFRAVLAHGVPLTGTLATIYMPRPRVSSGLCDMIPFNCALWT